MAAAWDIYAKELFPLGHGHPLAEPTSESGKVRLGDVGYLRRGHFCFLFNTLERAGSTAHSNFGVPEDYQTFRPPNLMERQRLNEITQRQLYSKNLQSAAIAATASLK